MLTTSPIQEKSIYIEPSVVYIYVCILASHMCETFHFIPTRPWSKQPMTWMMMDWDYVLSFSFLWRNTLIYGHYYIEIPPFIILHVCWEFSISLFCEDGVYHSFFNYKNSHLYRYFLTISSDIAMNLKYFTINWTIFK